MAVWEAVGAVSTFAGAMAAWRAALASERTSREARDALAAAVEPAPWIELLGQQKDMSHPGPAPTRLMIRIVNMDRWPATDLEAEATFADDGQRFREFREELGPYAVPPSGGVHEDWLVPLRDITWSSPGFVDI